MPPDPIILALDTSSARGSVALARGPVILKASVFEADRGHSQRLLPAIDGIFTEAKLQVREVDLFAAVIGPGSFTGLRVSLACLRGLAGEKPCFGAIGTDVAAWAGRGRATRVLSMTDLFHGEVFAGVYDGEGALVSKRESGSVSSVLEALKDLLAGGGLAIGSAALKHQTVIESVCAGLTYLDLPEGLSPHLAALASARAGGANTCRSSDMLPFYLRDPLSRGLLNTQPKVK